MVTRDLIVATARNWVGTPYHHQAAVRGAGCDCLGMIRGVYRELYGSEPEQPPPYTPTWGDYSAEELMLGAARRHLVEVASVHKGLVLRNAVWLPGDVLLFRPRPDAVAKHCAVVTGPDSMVHSYTGVGVTETSIGIWAKRVVGVFSFPGIDRE